MEDSLTQSETSGGGKWFLFGVLLGVLLLLDQSTKLAIHTTFHLYESHPVIDGFFNLTYVRNSGAAFGIFSRQDSAFLRYFFLAITLLAVVGLTVYYHRVPSSRRWTPWGIACTTSGAIGNGIDRLWLGQVIDFLDVYVNHYHWPAFNVADSAICVGVGCLLFDALRPHSS